LQRGGICSRELWRQLIPSPDFGASQKVLVGPQDFRLNEPMPADIALDADYMTELRRREALIGSPGKSSKSQKEFSDEIVQEAQNPILEGAPKLPDAKDIEQSCLADKKRGSPR
jgi:hypothetical protein